MELLTIETGPFDDPPPRPNRTRRRVAVLVVLAIACVAVAAFVSADGSRSSSTELIADPGPPADQSPEPAIVTSPDRPVGAATQSTYSSTSSGSSSFGGAGPLGWVLQSCLADNGFSPPTGPSSEADMRALQTKMADAYRACRDFLPPVNLPPERERLYACLRENGIDIDPRIPTAPVADADAVKRAAVACRSLVPEPPAGMPSAYRDYSNCMADNGVFIDLPIQMDAATRDVASEKCAALLPAPAVPPEQEKYFACLTSNGVEANVKKYANATSAPPEVDPEIARAAAQACRSLRPVNGAPSGYTEFVNCMEDHGVIQGAPVRSSASAMQTANTACREYQPKPTLPPPYQAYATCLGEQGLEVEFFADTPSPTYDSELAAAAAKACRELRPATGAPTGYIDYVDCMEEHGALSSVPVRVPDDVRSAASQACADLQPKPPGPPSLPPEVQKWYDCLTEHGVTNAPNSKPDYDVARAAAKACESLAPKAGYSTGD